MYQVILCVFCTGEHDLNKVEESLKYLSTSFNEIGYTNTLKTFNLTE